MWIFYPSGSSYTQRDHLLFEDHGRFEELTGYQLKRSPTLNLDGPADHMIVYDAFGTRVGDAYKKRPIC